MEGEQAYCPSGRFWEVQEGDTLYTIAQQLGIEVADLAQLNPGVDPYSLEAGTSLCLPPELPPCASGIYWRVSPGDTLYDIARAAGTTLGKLFELNPGLDPQNLKVDQAICLPFVSEISLRTHIIDKNSRKSP
jgi:LysM repeat protein